MNGDHRSGSHRAGSGGSRGPGGGYGRGHEGGEPPGRGGPYPGRPQSGGYPQQHPRDRRGPYPRDEHGRYGSGQYPINRSGGRYPADRDGGRYSSGGYGGRSRSGQYRSGQYARGGSGSHRIVHSRPPHRRLGVVLLGAAAGVAVCILAVFLVLGMGGDGKGEDTGGLANSGVTAGAADEQGERAFVPDACQVVDEDLAEELAPDADRNQSDTYQANDRQNQCVWGVYSSGKKRVLTVELRAIAPSGGGTGADAAAQTFQREREDDQSGKALLPGQRLVEKRTVEDVGDEAYAIYAVDSSQDSGEAVVNVRWGNTLITVHYSGTDKGRELSEKAAIDGAVAAAESAIATLGRTG